MKPIEDQTPADQVLARVASNIRVVETTDYPALSACPVGSTVCPHHVAILEGSRHRDELLADTARMIAPMYKAFSNGGLPSKRGGQELKIGPIKVTGEQAMALFWRGVTITMLLVVMLLLHGVNVKYEKGLLEIKQSITDRGSVKSGG